MSDSEYVLGTGTEGYLESNIAAFQLEMEFVLEREFIRISYLGTWTQPKEKEGERRGIPEVS